MISYYNPNQPIELRYHVTYQSLIWNKYQNINRQFVHTNQEYVCQKHLSSYIESIISITSIVGITILPEASENTCACCDPVYPAAWNSDLPGFVYIGHDI